MTARATRIAFFAAASAPERSSATKLFRRESNGLDALKRALDESYGSGLAVLKLGREALEASPPNLTSLVPRKRLSDRGRHP